MASNTNVPGDPDRLLSVEELAAVVGIPVRSVRQWAVKGTGPRRLRVGKYVRYKASDVRAWLDSQYVD